MPHDSPLALLHDRGCAVGPQKRGSRRGRFFANVSHAEDARRIPGTRCARDVAHFFAVESERRGCFRHNVAGKSEPHALTVDLAARTHALHDFLTRVTALGVADVAVLQSRLVGDLFFAEIVAEPWH